MILILKQIFITFKKHIIYYVNQYNNADHLFNPQIPQDFGLTSKYKNNS